MNQAQGELFICYLSSSAFLTGVGAKKRNLSHFPNQIINSLKIAARFYTHFCEVTFQVWQFLHSCMRNNLMFGWFYYTTDSVESLGSRARVGRVLSGAENVKALISKSLIQIISLYCTLHGEMRSGIFGETHFKTRSDCHYSTLFPLIKFRKLKINESQGCGKAKKQTTELWVLSSQFHSLRRKGLPLSAQLCRGHACTFSKPQRTAYRQPMCLVVTQNNNIKPTKS